jgi:hypothetical protein
LTIWLFIEESLLTIRFVGSSKAPRQEALASAGINGNPSETCGYKVSAKSKTVGFRSNATAGPITNTRDLSMAVNSAGRRFDKVKMPLWSRVISDLKSGPLNAEISVFKV